jgi:L-seryl-tRNA(Ser) seleniumtransferase
LIVGRREPLARIRAHPLARAMRIDKLDLAALEATLRLYRDPERAWEEVPVLRLLARDARALEAAARDLAARVARELADAADVDVVQTSSEAGGGALPGADLASWAVAVRPRAGGPESWDRRLRRHRPPVFARIADDRLLLDVRTLDVDDLELLIAALRAAAQPPAPPSV